MLTAIISRPEPGWMDQAACRSQNPAIFFPDDGGSCYPRLDEAREICARCPVRGECLEDAIATGETRYGIRAGLTPDQMKPFTPRRLRRCPAPGCARHASGEGQHPGYCSDACYTQARRVQQARGEARRRAAS